MLVTVLSRLISATLDAFSFALLIPLLNLLFPLPPGSGATTSLVPQDNAAGSLLNATIGLLTEGRTAEQMLRTVILIIIGVVIVKNLFVWWGGVSGARLQELVHRDLRNEVYAHVLRLPMTYHLRNRLGQILSRLLSDTREAKQVVTQLVTQALQNTATVIASTVLLFAISVQLSLYSLVIAPLVILALQPLLRRLRRGYRRTHSELGEMNSLAQEVLGGARLVKASRSEEFEEQRFARTSNDYMRGMIRMNKYSFLAQPITEIIGTLVAVGLLWMGTLQVWGGAGLDGAALITFMIVTLRLLQPLKQLSQLPAVAQGSLAAAERLFDVLDRPTEAAQDPGSRVVSTVSRGISFRNVSFDYGADGAGGVPTSGVRGAAISQVSLEVRPGEVVALVGPSGAGKSTLLDLLPRFHEPTSGAITLDDVDLREFTLSSLRALIGVVSQETILFNDTVRNNVAYGVAHGAPHDRVVRAAELANAHEFIMRLPDGYDTMLGERGSRLSGGERQRIAIARALLADPPILILDEATSSLDTESERLVQQAIDRLLEGRTVFVIAHRLSTVMHADQILVLESGSIVERGRHADLIALDGLYARLHALQFQDPARGNGA